MAIIQANGWMRRRCEFDVTLVDANGSNAVLGAGDQVRVKIGRAGETPLLEFISGTPSANGSSATAANPSRIVITATDLADPPFRPGAWDLEINIIDVSLSNAILHVETGFLNLNETELGAVGL